MVVWRGNKWGGVVLGYPSWDTSTLSERPPSSDNIGIVSCDCGVVLKTHTILKRLPYHSIAAIDHTPRYGRSHQCAGLTTQTP